MVSGGWWVVGGGWCEVGWSTLWSIVDLILRASSTSSRVNQPALIVHVVSGEWCVVCGGWWVVGGGWWVVGGGWWVVCESGFNERECEWQGRGWRWCGVGPPTSVVRISAGPRVHQRWYQPIGRIYKT